jgi:3-hydroxy-9,10-secoandrosta-1,3,5(10)-triene-9,17-dione monooxygenase reductase component
VSDRPSDLDVELWPGATIHADSANAAAAARRYRDVLGRFASGVTVVTALGDRPVGLTCQSFMSVSLDPPLVVFSPAQASRSWPLIASAGAFCVNFLAADQEDLSRRMASRRDDKFDGVSWRPSPETGSPVLAGTLGYVDCRIHAVHEAGDHRLVVGRVVDLATTDEPEALTFFQGRYGSLG